MKKKLKRIPEFKTEAEERRFWETHDSTQYVAWSQAKSARFPNLKPSTQAISLRLPASLLDEIKIEANKRDVPYRHGGQEDHDPQIRTEPEDRYSYDTQEEF